MDDSLFGPWKMDPPVNKWHEWKIGKLDSWYAVSALCLQTTNSSGSVSSRSSSGNENKSMIPRFNKRAANQQNQIINLNIEKEASEQVVDAPKPQPRFSAREMWDDPRPFDRFISSPNYQLLGWPTKAVALVDAIGGSSKEMQIKPPSGKSPKQRRSQIPMKR